ncbi:hematopoietic prostaglandin D synthase-like [Dendronephthya gigantea]|uniref:hematopoietic prostaglandin D synthase-like n=1 Tax=Dendronephthya gigantea TaxID=151771 RepID=UPI00106DADCF|nr:hematopoietic prostaglandin D synthase-like [Dendronephthya gigantea]
MPSYKLTYFNVRGRAEKIRLLFAAGGTEYEDYRFKDGEEFRKLKEGGTFPFGQVPVLEVDGKMLCQSMSIFRFVAREIGFSPSDDFEIAKADMVVDGLVELMEKAVAAYREKDPELKKSLFKTFAEKEFPDGLVAFEKLLKAGGGKYFAGNKMTYADIMFYSSVESAYYHEAKEGIPAVLDRFPLLKDLYETVGNNPGIKDWVKKRPDTQM